MDKTFIPQRALLETTAHHQVGGSGSGHGGGNKRLVSLSRLVLGQISSSRVTTGTAIAMHILQVYKEQKLLQA